MSRRAARYACMYRDCTAKDWGKVIFAEDSFSQKERIEEMYHKSIITPTVKHPETILM